MNGASSGLSACVNSIPSSPQPHHFISATRTLASTVIDAGARVHHIAERSVLQQSERKRPLAEEASGWSFQNRSRDNNQHIRPAAPPALPILERLSRCRH